MTVRSLSSSHALPKSFSTHPTLQRDSAGRRPAPRGVAHGCGSLTAQGVFRGPCGPRPRLMDQEGIRKGSGRDLDVFEVCFSKIDGYVWDMEGIYACM